MRKLLLLSAAVGAALAGTAARADDTSSTTLSGLMYFDVTSIATKKDVTPPAPAAATSTDIDPNGIGTDVKRFYVGVNHSFDDQYSVNFTSDFNYSATTGETQMFVKKAYLQDKFNDLAVLSIGSNNEPWIPFVEGLYGYRFVENTLTDKEKIGNSADWGVHLKGDGGMWNYDVAVVNGGGYKNPTRSKTVDEEARVAFIPVSGLTLALGLYSGDLGQDTEANEATFSAKVPPVGKNTATRTDFLADWKGGGLNVGVEYVDAKNDNTGLIFNNVTDSENGYSVFADYSFQPGMAIFGRVDQYKPNKDTNSSNKDKYYNVGFSWQSNSNITWALVYKNDELDTFSSTAANATETALKTSEFGLWAQVKF
jgi:hypothetical protein